MTDVDVAIAAAEVGADIVRRSFGTALQRIDKGAGDFATSADIEAERAMTSLLRRERPDDAVHGEESGRSGEGARSRIWLIDPLCGTLNYAARMRVAGVNIALKAAGKCVAAAVADPFNGEIFWTDGRSAHVRVLDRDALLKPDASSRLVDLNLDPPFPNGSTFRATTLAADSDFRREFRPRVVSSSIAAVWVATGQRAAYVTDGDLCDSVHFAAGLAICEAAGCIVTDLWGGVWGAAPTGLVVAADRETHRALLACIQKQSVPGAV